MKISIRFFRWVFLGLYVLVIVSLTAMGLSLWNWDTLWTLLSLGLLVGSQMIFLFGVGTIELCRPLRRRRLIIPVVVASLMMAILAGALSLALGELTRLEGESWAPHAFWGIMALNWIIWGIFLFIYSRGVERYRVLRRLITTVLAGSLVELLASVPSHLVVSRRPGCFVGIYTATGIIGGLYVMLWAFGPGIILLFLRDRRESELGKGKTR